MKLNADQLRVLSLGLNFATKNDKVSKTEVMAQLEVLKHQLKDSLKPTSEKAEIEYNTRISALCYGFMKSNDEVEWLPENDKKIAYQTIASAL
ncbi:hypothetical protein Ciccas_011036 [Cichlidogyrus casuarinus]|uniref:Uncharacterized protein n=1 Tax=Cichlidogyrus casuarinus TaxID=1844966 RepID=A0ABD2PU25_9PLAT